MNLYTYCANNPIIYIDPSGNFAEAISELWNESEQIIGEVGQYLSNTWETAKGYGGSIASSFASYSGGYVGCGAIAASDGPLPVLDIVAAVAAVSLTAYCVYDGVNNYNDIIVLPSEGAISRAKGQSITFDKTKSNDETLTVAKEKTYKLPSDTVIYRWGSNSPGNLTPKEKDRYTGLSFSLVPPIGKAYVETTVAMVNSTGILVAKRDDATHFSIVPAPSVATLDEWIEEGTNHICTQTLQSIVTKHKKKE